MPAQQRLYLLRRDAEAAGLLRRRVEKRKAHVAPCQQYLVQGRCIVFEDCGEEAGVICIHHVLGQQRAAPLCGGRARRSAASPGESMQETHDLGLVPVFPLLLPQGGPLVRRRGPASNQPAPLHKVELRRVGAEEGIKSWDVEAAARNRLEPGGGG